MKLPNRLLAAGVVSAEAGELHDHHFDFLRVTDDGVMECRMISQLRRPKAHLLIDNVEITISEGELVGCPLNMAPAKAGFFTVNIPRVYFDDAQHHATAVDEAGRLLGEMTFRLPRKVSGKITNCDLSGAVQGVVEVSGLRIENLALRLLINGRQSIPFILGPKDLKRDEENSLTRFTFRLRLPNNCRTGDPAATSLILDEADSAQILDEKVFRTKAPRQGRRYMRSPVKRMAIVETSLTEPRGHMIAAIEVFVDIARSMDLEPVIIGNKKFKGEGISGVKVKAEFSKSIYEISSLPSMNDQLTRFGVFRDTFTKELKGVLDRYGGEDTLFFYPTVNEYLIGALADVLKSRAFSAAEYHLICLMLETGVQRDDAGEPKVVDPIKVELFREAFATLAGACGPRQENRLQDHTHIAAISETHRANYQLLSPIPIRSMPPLYGFSGKLDKINADIVKAPDRKRVLLYLGEAKEDKGFALAPKVAESLLAQDSSLELVVQVHNATTPAEQEAAERLRAMAGRNLRIYEGFLPRDVYMNLLAATDAVVMAYDPKRYACKTSGVFWEAMSFGAPVVVPDQTWLQQEAILSEADMECFSLHTADDVGKAIETLLKRTELGTTRTPVKDMVAEAHAFFNSALSDFCATGLTFADVFNPDHNAPRGKDLATPGRLAISDVLMADEKSCFVSGWSEPAQSYYHRPARWMAAEASLRLDAERGDPLDVRITGERSCREDLADALTICVDGLIIKDVAVDFRNARDFVISFTAPPRAATTPPSPTWMQISVDMDGADGPDSAANPDEALQINSISFAPVTSSSEGQP